MTKLLLLLLLLHFLLRDGALDIQVEVEMVGERLVCDESVECGPVLGSQWVLENLYADLTDSDFTLICREMALPVHKQVLIGASPYFKSLLKQHTAESK
jgi:hypothetical protein